MRKHHLASEKERGYLQVVSVHAGFPIPDWGVHFPGSCVDNFWLCSLPENDRVL